MGKHIKKPVNIGTLELLNHIIAIIIIDMIGVDLIKTIMGSNNS
jgi:hypothetical protein